MAPCTIKTFLMPEQFGFTTKHSTQKQLRCVILKGKVQYKETKCLDDKYIFLNISIFDKVWQEGLIYKLI